MSSITANIERPEQSSGRIARVMNWLKEQPWWMHAVMVYGFFIPVIAMHLPGVGGVGAADLLMPLGFFIMVCVQPKGRLILAHLALAGFMLAALASLLQIDESKPAIDCTIRWIRLAGILMPFFFGLFLPVTDKLINRALIAWGLGGLFAVSIGIFLHTFQIEVREGQQKLWMDGGAQLRAGGLIGNSGAFGHMTSTWAVITVISLLSVCRSKYRFIWAGCVVMLTFYVIYIASSRAALMHLMAATGVFCALFRVSKSTRQNLVFGAIIGLPALVLMFCLSSVMPSNSEGGESKALQTNLERFIPGMSGDAGEFTSNRADNWPEYIAMMNEKVLFGWGYKMGVRLHEESPDNSYLSVMLETGLIGFTCMSLFVVATFYRLGHLYFAGDPYAIIMIAAGCGQLANCMTSDIYTFWITMPVVFMMLGLISLKPATTGGRELILEIKESK